MARFEISKEADQDLVDIYDFSFATFGEAQADRYQASLREAFRLLATRPKIGAVFQPSALGLRRFRRERHIIFYRPEPYGVLIVRVLHEMMDHVRHLRDEADD